MKKTHDGPQLMLPVVCTTSASVTETSVPVPAPAKLGQMREGSMVGWKSPTGTRSYPNVPGISWRIACLSGS